MISAELSVRKKFDLTGQAFGRLTVRRLAYVRRLPGATKPYWLCRCDCGMERPVSSTNLRQGKAKSCGYCEKPGGLRTEWPGYSSHKSAKMRCYNPNNRAFPDYGGRGVGMCDRWRFGEGGKTGFECFFEDMGPRPSGMTLDRIDNNGNYEPGNCRWASKQMQQQNQRDAIYARIGGVAVPLKKYVARIGLCYESVRFRVRRRDETVLQAARGLLSRRRA